MLYVNQSIENLKARIDSLHQVVKFYSTKENESYRIDRSLIEEAMDEDSLCRLKLANLLVDKISVLQSYNPQVFKFRDSAVFKEYLTGYYDRANAIPDTSLCLLPKKSIACNAESGRIVYGFVNLHLRNNKGIVDFEKFNRIGIYSLFPETFGSIEMIFASNKCIKDSLIAKSLLSQAHRYNTKVDLVLSFYNWSEQSSYRPRFNMESVMWNMVDSLSKIIQKYHFDGITIDFDISRMSLTQIFQYKEFIFKIKKELKAFKNRKLNIIVSAQDVLDTVKCTPDEIDNASRKTKKSADTTFKKTKLEWLLYPDHIDYIDLILINCDFSYLQTSCKYKAVCPVDGLHDDKRDTVGIKKLVNSIKSSSLNYYRKVIIKCIPVIPLYANVWYRSSDQKIEIKATIPQKQFIKCDAGETFKSDFKILEKDTNMFIDDLSSISLHNKISMIYDSFPAGIGLWNIEYGDNSFFQNLYDLYYGNLLRGITPQALMFRYGHWLRRIIGPNKEIAGGILLFFVLCAVGFVIYARWYGREKLLNKYKVHFIISGLILLISVYIYLLAIPDIVPNTIEDILIISGLIIIISAVLRYVYKLKQAGDLP